MAKKTARSRSAAQRSGSRQKQKSFELVRPTSEVDVLETTEDDEELEEVDDEEEETDEDETEDEVEVVKRPSASQRVSAPSQPIRRVVETESLAKISASATSVAPAPASAAARLAARRQNAQKEKNQRPAANLILAENYAYVRKDLIFILILAIIMFAGILVLHFVPAIGG